MGEKKSKGLLVSVIGVLALAIAVFGGTYAWFTATVNAPAATTTTTGNLAITYTAGGSNVVASNLKPATPAQVLTAYGQAGTAKCRYGSETGEQICSATTFTVTNTGELTAAISGKLISASSTFVDNKLMYAFFESAPGTLTGTPLVVAGSEVTLSGITGNLAVAGSKTYTLLIWLDSTAVNSGANNNSGKTFTGTISITGSQTNAS